MSKQTELAWAAGFFDGEGSFSTNKGYITAHVTQADDLPILKRFHRAVGIGRIYGPYQRQARWKPFAKWQAIATHEVDELFRLLSPYLSPVKKRQYRTVKAKARRPAFARPNYVPPTHCSRGHKFTKENTGSHLRANGKTNRYCKKCHHEACKRRYRRSKAA